MTTTSGATVPPGTYATTLGTSSPDSAAATKAAVVAAVVQSRQDYMYAIEHYDAPDALDVLARTTVRDSPSWSLTVDNINTLRSNGWKARPDPVVPSTSMVEGEVTLLDGPPASEAQATVCTIDAGIIFKPAAAPDGADLVINDKVTARRNRVTLQLQDGQWKLRSGEGLGTWPGETSCPAA